MVRKSAATIRNRATGTWNRVVRNDIKRIKDQIVSVFSPNRVILFGSHAQGQADADSDVDLLVVMPEEAKTTTSLDIRRAVRYSTPLDVLVYSQGDLDARVSAGDYFLQDILETGVILHERPCE